MWVTWPPSTLVPDTAASLMASTENVTPAPAVKNRTIIPTSRPMSPTRLVRKALSAASLFSFSSHQWPIRTNEQTPTSSQATIIWMMLALITSINIDAVKG